MLEKVGGKTVDLRTKTSIERSESAQVSLVRGETVVLL